MVLKEIVLKNRNNVLFVIDDSCRGVNESKERTPCMERGSLMHVTVMEFDEHFLITNRFPG